MLIRRNGGKEGIKEYLEKGQKHDRYFTRDDLDERVILNGNLSRIDNIITNMTNKGERYFHITLSFKEDAIEESILSKISDEFRNFYFNAFNDDEIMFYSEAHLPRIKTYKDSDGNIIERKPHIHIVVPKINLVTGESVDYKELYNRDYADAFQEYINAKYGLESPKDNPRYKVNDNSEYISRYKGDGFKGKGKDVKLEILDQILENNISSIIELEKYLASSGFVIKLRNSHKFKGTQYLNITKDEMAMNLNDHVFSDKFLALSKENKLLYLNANSTDKKARKYLIPGTAQTIEQHYLDTLIEWQTIKSLELKYHKNLSPRQREIYKKLSKEDKIKHLNKLHEHHAINLRERENHEQPDRRFKSREFSRIIDLYMESTRSNLESFKDDVTRHCGIERENITRRWRDELQRRYSANSRQSTTGERRYGDNKSGGNSGSINPENSSVLGSIKYQSTKINYSQNKALINDFNEIVPANILLEVFEKSHGLNPEIYKITKSANGVDRIGAGNRNYSNYDFCIHEMHLSQNDALAYLYYAKMLNQEINHKLGYENTNGSYLIDEYKIWFKDYKKERASIITKNKSDLKNEIEKIKSQYKEKIIAIKNDKTIFYHKKNSMIQAIKFEQTIALQNANKISKMSDYNLRQKYNLEMQESYRIFLMKRANEDDEQALRELRRLRIDYSMSIENLSISYTQRFNEFKLPVSYEIDKNGIINYKVNDAIVIKDHGIRVEVVKSNDDYVDLSLKLAMKKFGNNLSIRGKEDFRKKCVEHALKKGYEINYLDDFSKEYHSKLVTQLKEKELIYSRDNEQLNGNTPQKLIISDIYQDEILIHNRQQKVNIIEVQNIDNGNRYKLQSDQINFAAKNLETGDFVNVKYSKDSLEPQIFRTPEAKIFNSMKRESIAILLKKYQDELKSSEYIGIVTKTGSQDNPVVILKQTKNYTFVKISNQDIYQQLKDVRLGSEVVIRENGSKASIEYVKQKTTSLLKITNPESLVGKYKKNSATIIAKVDNYKKFMLNETTPCYRVSIINVVTGEKSAIFTQESPALEKNNIISINKNGWNNYHIEIIKELEQELIMNSSTTKNITRGKIISAGYREIRGKPVYQIGLQTMNGVVHKYGDAIREKMTQNDIATGDWVQLAHEQIVSEKTIIKPSYEVINLSNEAEKLAKIRLHDVNISSKL